jgi:regulatory helix-turn-helix LysR family protein
MGLSQPAVSAHLSRLRRHFRDELLVRVGNQYRLTPLGQQLKERVRVALSGAERVFSAEPDFDPASSTREFSLLTSDYGIAVLGPIIAGLLAAEAPGTGCVSPPTHRKWWMLPPRFWSAPTGPVPRRMGVPGRRGQHRRGRVAHCRAVEDHAVAGPLVEAMWWHPMYDG